MELFADGKSLGKDNSNWGIADTFLVPGDTRVISVAGQHFGGAFGVIGSLSNGLVTNGAGNAAVFCLPDGIPRISMTSSGHLQMWLEIMATILGKL